MPKKAAAKKAKLAKNDADDADVVVVKFISDVAELDEKNDSKLQDNIKSVTIDKLHTLAGWDKASKTKKDKVVAALLSILSGAEEEDVKDKKEKEPAKDTTKETKAEENGDNKKEKEESGRKRKRRIAKPGCVLVSDCIKVHNAIHDYPNTKSVTLSTGETVNVTIASNKCKKAVVGGVSFMEQNTTKTSTFARKAKQGHKITWVLLTGKWGMLCDGRVEIDCPLFDHDDDNNGDDVDGDDDDEEEDGGSSSTTTTSKKKAAPAKELSDTHLLSLSISFPKYWENPGAKSPSRIALSDKSDEFKKLAAMFYKTAEVKVVVKKITRLQHPILWMRYFLKRQHVAEANNNKPEKVSYVLTELLDNTTNEYYFFHGCNPAVVDKIIDGGFDERLGSLSGLFGSGIYFAENSAKSIAYTHTPSCKQVGANYGNSVCTCKGSKDPRNMFISRAVVGTPWIRLVATDRENPMRRPPERPDGSLYDSVMGECKKHDKQAHLPVREYIVYDRHQTYPEYLVEFCYE